MAILRKKEEMEGYNIDNEVIKYIATNIKSNIRELEGALTKIVALSRQIVMYLCREIVGTPLQMIGKYLGGRDHTTIIHGIEKIKADIGKNDSNLINTLDILKKKLSPQ